MALHFVNPDLPFQAAYAVYQHEYLGYIISSHVIQVLSNGQLSLIHQGLHPANFEQFAHQLNEQDYKLVKLLHEITQQEVIRKFAPGQTAEQFFKRGFKGEIEKFCLEYIDRRLNQALPMLRDMPLYEMGNDGYPARRRLEVQEDQASILFHFDRNEDSTQYYPTLKIHGRRVDFQFKDALLLTRNPAWMMLGNEVFTFVDGMEGIKLKPFLNKRNISIPKSTEDEYFRKFVLPMLEKYDVTAKGGMIIRVVEASPVKVLEVAPNGADHLSIRPYVLYDGVRTTPGRGGKVAVDMVLEEANYVFTKRVRNISEEETFMAFLNRHAIANALLGMEMLPRGEALQWLARHFSALEAMGVKVDVVGMDLSLRFGQPQLSFEVTDHHDWFDIQAVVSIGQFRIPFIRFRNHILHGRREFILPDGTVLILPETWYSDYRHLLEVAVAGGEDTIRLRRMQAGLLEALPIAQEQRTWLTLNPEEFSSSIPTPMVEAELRPYQLDGYQWMQFLHRNHLGGILADDMGLGKTLQAIALLSVVADGQVPEPSLVVMPTSLLFNWAAELRKYAPQIRFLVYEGNHRERLREQFCQYQVILTSYGLLRQDIGYLKAMQFHYTILDESQAIKNPESRIHQAVLEIQAYHRLTLTGTPIENRLTDLWSQMEFLNPGMLGARKFFEDFYVHPIQVLKDEKRSEGLRKLLRPFLLRRTKEEVARDLPPRIDQIRYCDMTDEQSKIYDEMRSSWRNYLLEATMSGEFSRKKLNILTGLQKLRQIAIHPAMLPEFPDAPSGKFEEFTGMLEEVLGEKRKVLVFSQFVRMLSIVRTELDKNGVRYAYLDGSTKDRQGAVASFQEDPEVQVFLLSLKAGGVGLNLTAAEYVFILDPWWNPAVENQAVDRAHRIGQQKTVFTYKFITRGTIEEKILRLQEEKQALVKNLIVTDDSLNWLESGDLEKLLS